MNTSFVTYRRLQAKDSLRIHLWTRDVKGTFKWELRNGQIQYKDSSFFITNEVSLTNRIPEKRFPFLLIVKSRFLDWNGLVWKMEVKRNSSLLPISLLGTLCSFFLSVFWTINPRLFFCVSRKNSQIKISLKSWVSWFISKYFSVFEWYRKLDLTRRHIRSSRINLGK